MSEPKAPHSARSRPLPVWGRMWELRARGDRAAGPRAWVSASLPRSPPSARLLLRSPASAVRSLCAPAAAVAAAAAEPRAAWQPHPRRRQTFPGAGAGESERSAGRARAGRGQRPQRGRSGGARLCAGRWDLGILMEHRRPREPAGAGWARLGSPETPAALGGSRNTARCRAPSLIHRSGAASQRADTCGFYGARQGARPGHLPSGSGTERASLQLSQSCP